MDKKERPKCGPMDAICCLLLQIHDELLIETHLDEFEEVKEILQNEMMNAVSLRVPLNIDIEQGASWYEAK